MGQVSNRFFVTSIKDGTIVSAVIYSNKPLAQLVTPGTNASSPDWTNDASSRPTVQCVTRTGASVKTPASYKWYLNGTEITFPNLDNGTKNNNAGVLNECFQIVKDNTNNMVDGVAVPTIKIIKNIITWANNDNDVLTCAGFIEYNGAHVDYSVSTTIRASALSGSGYYGWIEGDSYVTAQSGAGGTASMKAYLTTADGSVNKFKTKWFREGVTQYTENWPSGGKAIDTTNGHADCSITGAEISDYVVIRCDFYAEGDNTYQNKLFSAYWDVDDMEDEEEMYIASYNDNSDVSNGLDVCLRQDQVVQFLIWMGKRGDQTKIDTRYTIFKVKLLDYEGNVITSLTGKGVEKKNGSGNWVGVVDGDVSGGFITITSSTTKTGYNGNSAFACGMIKIPASFSDINGGRITGIVTATSA